MPARSRTTRSELAVWLYPKGQEPKHREVLGLFNFNWHNMYIYDDDVAPRLPKGTILHMLAWYDNTKANRSNPDPDQWVGWGDRTSTRWTTPG